MLETMRDITTGCFCSLAENVFTEARLHERIVEYLFPQIFEKGNGPRLPFESNATIAVLSVLFANGDDSLLADMSPEIIMPFNQVLFVLRVTDKLLRKPTFTFELFNGDARPLIDESIDEVADRFGPFPCSIFLLSQRIQN